MKVIIEAIIETIIKFILGILLLFIFLFLIVTSPRPSLDGEDRAFFNLMQKKYDFVESYSVRLCSSNNRVLAVEYDISSTIYNSIINDCFEETKDYIIRFKEENKLDSVMVIDIRFIDKKNNYKSYFSRRESTAEELTEAERFSLWKVMEYMTR